MRLSTTRHCTVSKRLRSWLLNADAPEAHKCVDGRDDAIAIAVEKLNVLYDVRHRRVQHSTAAHSTCACLRGLHTCWMTV